MNFIREKIDRTLDNLYDRIVMDREKIENIEVYECGYKGKTNEPPKDAVFKKYTYGATFGGTFEWHGWFKSNITIPERMKNIENTSIEMYNYITRGRVQFTTYFNGKTLQAQDENHKTFPIDKNVNSFDLLSYVYIGYNSDVTEYTPELRLIDNDTKNLYWNIKIPNEVLSFTAPESADYYDIMNTLDEAINLIDFRTRGEEYRESVRKALSYLEKNFYKGVCRKQEANCVCIGHTHIDVAWLWPLRQTREKAQRSFATVVNLMKEFPEYKFMSSQPQLYEFVKEDDPKLYEEIKKLVKEGRWEVEGAMWLEADCNLPSGESFVRQLVFGKTFIKDEFGVDSKVLWLPDVFGYSAALPQILRKAGVTRFVTSKISWNETNKMPYDVFSWEGIDGTKIFSYFLTAQAYEYGKAPTTFVTYNGKPGAKEIRGTWERFQQKDISREVLMTYGFGDGGGGTTREMIESLKRIEKGIPGCPTVSFEFAGDFLDRQEKTVKDNRNFPTWSGELYLEFHRGTYTSMAKNKRNNRKSEFLYQNAETFSSLATSLLGKKYDQKTLNEGWKKILLCQFHDIIPGSSIKEVYDDSDKIYEGVFESGNKVLNNALTSIAKKIDSDKDGVVVFNPNSFVSSSSFVYDGKSYFAKDVPAKGYTVVYELDSNTKAKIDLNKRVLENQFVKVKFDKNFEISSLFEKKAKREVLPAGQKANMLEAYEDIPKRWDAWEITNYYKEKKWNINTLESVEEYRDGVYVGFKVTRKFQNSTIEQIIRISDKNAVVDFVTTIDWKNDHILLKAAFPTNINSQRATYEIQYGNTERNTHQNTSWDQAKFEVCAHKWVDFSEYDFGLALMNDCKYGHDICNKTMRISLLKSATYPNPAADKEVHHITYSIYPHTGNYATSGVVKHAYELNNPLMAIPVKKQKGSLPKEFSAVKCNMDNIFVDILKKAEKSDDLVCRLYDAYNKTSTATLTFGFDVKKAYICDLLENEIEEVKVVNNKAIINVKPFEIVTLKLVK